MSISIQTHRAPRIAIPKFVVDEKIHARLDQIELLSLMNKSFACLIMGKAGSGKTSLLMGLLGSRDAFKECFDRIYLFMPANSQASIKNSIFERLPKEQIYDKLNIENLSEVFSAVEDLSENDMRSLIIFDDVQQFFKGECEALINHMIANRRHNRLSLFFIAQSYKKVPRSCRLQMSDLFCFRLSKADMEDIKTELLDVPEDVYNNVLATYNQHTQTHPKSFLYFNTLTNRIFIDWNEVTFNYIT